MAEANDGANVGNAEDVLDPEFAHDFIYAKIKK